MDAGHLLVAGVEDRLVEWLQTIPGFVNQLERHCTTNELGTAHLWPVAWQMSRLPLLAALPVQKSHWTYSGRRRYPQWYPWNKVSYDAHYQEWVLHLIDIIILKIPVAARTLTCLPGWPQHDIPQSQFEVLIELGFSYAAIALMLNVSPRTLRRRRAEFGLPAGRLYTEISDHQ